MPFGDLEEISMAEYVSRERGRAGLWFFLHIPKTAGSSFSTEMTKRIAPYRNVEVNYNDLSLDFDAKLSNAVDIFVAEMQLTKFRAASGHVPWELIEKIKGADPSTRVLSFLRSPVDRVISEYRYQLTPMHPQHRAFERQFPSIETYVEHELGRNQMTRFLFGNHREPSCDELVDHIRSNFTLVGLVEMYPLSFTSMFTAIGISNPYPVEFERRTKKVPKNTIAIGPEIVDQIRELNQLDVAAYNYVESILLRHRDDWFDVSGDA